MKKNLPEPLPYPEPPAHLSERAAALWKSLGPSLGDTQGRRVLFQSALESLDAADRAREAIAAEGMVNKTTSTGAVHLNPLLKIEIESRNQFAKFWKQLGVGLRRTSTW